MSWLVHATNLGAGQLLCLVWPMLWQSSLLIAVVWLADAALRRQARGAVRYALWLVVLVKLALPPTLAAPTGISWWVRTRSVVPAPRPEPAVASFAFSPVVPEPGPEIVAPAVPVSAPAALPPERLSPGAWGCLASGLVSLGLLAWVLVRWRGVVRQGRAGSAGPAWLVEMLEEERRRAGVRRPVELRLAEEAMSPAVCGSVRPVILLPRSLVSQLPPEGLRPVLLHELIHLRRGDLWVSWAQALLQLVYWWHPLVWLANARIRRVREEAVDDAVIVALEAGADSYAPALLAVARLGLPRLPAALGLVGILESRSALRDRIERLLDLPAPRKAGLTLTSGLCVVAFAAFAVPMGEGPAVVPAPAAPATTQTSGTNQTPAAPAPAGGVARATAAAQVDALPAGQAGPKDARARLSETLARERVVRGDLWSASSTRAASSDQVASPPSNPPSASATPPRAGRRWVVEEMDRITLDALGPWQISLVEAVRLLAEQTRSADPAQPGIRFSINTQFEVGPTNPAASGSTLAAGVGPATWDPATVAIKIDPAIRGVRLNDALDAITKCADQPIAWSVGEEGVVFRRKESEGVARQLLTMRLPDVLAARLGEPEPPAGQPREAVFQERCRGWLAGLGVNLAPPAIFFFNSREQTILVYATLAERDAIEQAVSSLNHPPGSQPKPTNGAAAPASGKGEPSGASSAGLPKSRAAERLQDGKLLYEMGKLDEAEARLKEARDQDPDNQAVRYYLNLVAAARLGGAVRAADDSLLATNPAHKVPAPPQIHLTTKFIQMPEAEAAAFVARVSPTNLLPENPTQTAGAAGGIPAQSTPPGPPAKWAVRLTPSQTRSELAHWGSLGGVEITSNQCLTMLSGGVGQLAIMDLMTVVVASNAPPTGDPGKTSPPFATREVAVGWALDAALSVPSNGPAIQLGLRARRKEFLGYDDPGQFLVASDGTNGSRPKAVVIPLPHFRLRDMRAAVTLWDGQSVVFGGPAIQEVRRMKDKVPVLGDIPLLGRLFRKESTETNRTCLVVLVTPVLVDSQGSRFAGGDDPPESEKSFPPEAKSPLVPMARDPFAEAVSRVKR